MTYWAQPPEPREQAVLFPQRLDKALPKEHVVRILDEMLSQINWGEWEAQYNGRIGQPPIHPPGRPAYYFTECGQSYEAVAASKKHCACGLIFVGWPRGERSTTRRSASFAVPIRCS